MLGQIGTNRSCGTSGSYILRHAIIIPMPAFKFVNIEDISELGIDGS